MQILELANRTLHSERENDLSTAKAKEDLLEERIRELDRETSELYDRVAALEVEKTQLLTRPSSSNASDFNQRPSGVIQRVDPC